MSSKDFDIGGFRPFNVNSDPNSVGSEWKRWLRSFQLYADGKGLIIEPEKDDNIVQRRALLLHCAGSDVQDIFDVLPETGNVNEYAKAKEVLTRYFVNQVNVPYERHMFGEMVQHEHETIDQFVVRLRGKAQQCDNCDYGDPLESQIRDQVISKYRSSHLRRRFLEKGQTLNLKQLQDIARTSEAVKRQAKSMCGPSDGVNRVFERPGRQARHGSKGEKSGKIKNSGECFRCGKPGHFATGKVAVSVGGVPLEMVIDSGASKNVIDKCLWENLKKKHIKCTSKRTTKKLYAYGSTTPLTVIRTFTANVNVAGKYVTTEFTVIEGKGEPLLGRKTAMELGVLKLQVPEQFVNNVTDRIRGVNPGGVWGGWLTPPKIKINSFVGQNSAIRRAKKQAGVRREFKILGQT